MSSKQLMEVAGMYIPFVIINTEKHSNAIRRVRIARRLSTRKTRIGKSPNVKMNVKKKIIK